MLTRILITLALAATLYAQDPQALASAKALYEEIRKLPDLPQTTRDAAFREMLDRIRKQPKQYRQALASNLAVSAGEVATEPATLQAIADLLIDEHATNPEGSFPGLAELAFYYHVKVPLADPRYRAELSKLEDLATKRAAADFTLTDVSGKSWHLKGLTGKIVLVNFWATWCAPCRRELEDLQALNDRGFLILAITNEDPATVKRFLTDHPLRYPILLDPGDTAKNAFQINGIPHTLLYNREGKLAAQLPGPFTKGQLLETLAQAGLK